ncbi:mitochondrial substrate carrier family protein [Actinidia rufa]|uniref:Mitochondrial substrate carrier family protein n=1 Tax=Actinidia rufa TaxID=165716 RepID=A0A7J0DIF9_9ERIC|nr:mitochondrial substrate carrier family protein [Actinidia rufa]
MRHPRFFRGSDSGEDPQSPLGSGMEGLIEFPPGIKKISGIGDGGKACQNAVVNGLAGAGGGIIAQIITYPLQSVNTRQHTERVAKKGGRSLPPTGGTLVQILQVVRSEGWGGLYSGLKPSLLGTAASQGIYYYFYQVFKNKAVAIAVARKIKGRGDGTVGVLSWLVVAAIAGVRVINVSLAITDAFFIEFLVPERIADKPNMGSCDTYAGNIECHMIVAYKNFAHS